MGVCIEVVFEVLHCCFVEVEGFGLLVGVFIDITDHPDELCMSAFHVDADIGGRSVVFC